MVSYLNTFICSFHPVIQHLKNSLEKCVNSKNHYKLKQSLRAWFGMFAKSMDAFGYHQSNSDHTLFLKKTLGKVSAFIVFIDDMIVIGKNLKEIKVLKEHLS